MRISDWSSDVCSSDLSYGAFRQVMFSYFTGQMTRCGRGVPIASAGYDDYTTLLRAGSASDYAKSIGLEQVPWWNKLTEHPAYDAFWQGQALDKLPAPSTEERRVGTEGGRTGRC